MSRVKLLVGVVVLGTVVATLASALAPAVPKEPARVEVTISPSTVAAGEEARVVVRLTPAAGVKINRYPKIKLKVPGQAGLVEAAEVAIGNSAPPPPDQIEKNYFKTVDPVELKFRVEPGAPVGEHRIAGQLSYYYCVAASGFCAPARVPVSIPFTVR